jgi:hypothetical protein
MKVADNLYLEGNSGCPEGQIGLSIAKYLVPVGEKAAQKTTVRINECP